MFYLIYFVDFCYCFNLLVERGLVVVFVVVLVEVVGCIFSWFLFMMLLLLLLLFLDS